MKIKTGGATTTIVGLPNESHHNSSISINIIKNVKKFRIFQKNTKYNSGTGFTIIGKTEDKLMNSLL